MAIIYKLIVLSHSRVLGPRPVLTPVYNNILQDPFSHLHPIPKGQLQLTTWNIMRNHRAAGISKGSPKLILAGWSKETSSYRSGWKEWTY